MNVGENGGLLSLEGALRNTSKDLVYLNDSKVDSFHVVPEIDLDHLPQTSEVNESAKKNDYNIYNHLDKIRSIPMDGDADPPFPQNLQPVRSKACREIFKTVYRPQSDRMPEFSYRSWPSYLLSNKTTTFSFAKLPDGDERKVLLSRTSMVKEVKLPIMSILDFEQLESDLNHNSPLKLNLMNSLAKAGGMAYENVIKSCLTMLLSADVYSQLSWSGRNGKKCFKNYLIKSVVFDAVRVQFRDVSDYELKDPVQLWFTRRNRTMSRRMVKGSNRHPK